VRVYIAGSISNGGTLNPEQMKANMVPFGERARWLEAQGYEPANPCDVVGAPEWTWRDWMRAALQMLLTADAISLLPGWEQSQGARLEWEVARSLNYPVVSP
jgi:hypothetical protein